MENYWKDTKFINKKKRKNLKIKVKFKLDQYKLTKKPLNLNNMPITKISLN